MGGVFSYIKKRRKSSIVPIDYGSIKIDLKDYDKMFPNETPSTRYKYYQNDLELHEFVQQSFKKREERRRSGENSNFYI